VTAPEGRPDGTSAIIGAAGQAPFAASPPPARPGWPPRRRCSPGINGRRVEELPQGVLVRACRRRARISRQPRRKEGEAAQASLPVLHAEHGGKGSLSRT
jgi:hypothetical protein